MGSIQSYMYDSRDKTGACLSRTKGKFLSARQTVGQSKKNEEENVSITLTCRVPSGRYVYGTSLGGYRPLGQAGVSFVRGCHTTHNDSQTQCSLGKQGAM